MTNKYIEIEMSPTAYGVGGSFHADASPRESICPEYLRALAQHFGN